MARTMTIPTVSKDEFIQTGQPITVTFEGQNLDDGVAIEATPQMFQSGGMGWQGAGNTEMVINGKPTKVWVKVVVSVVGAKNS